MQYKSRKTNKNKPKREREGEQESNCTQFNRKVFSSFRAANNFPAGSSQIVRTNLFLLGHIPFLAGHTSIITILNL